MATIHDVAREASVSIATVSRVLNDYEHVRPDVRSRVLKAAQALDYRPNKLASSLRKQHSESVGVLMYQQSTPFSSAIAYAIEKTLFTHRYNTLLCSTESDPEIEEHYVNMLIDHQVHGVVLRPAFSYQRSLKMVDKLLKHDISVVLIDIALPDAKHVSQVLSQNFQGGYDGLNYLIELGHRQIVVIAPDTDRDIRTKREPPGHLRLRGIQQAHVELDHAAEVTYLYTKETDHFKAGYDAAFQIFEQYPATTAIFAISDVMAAGAMHAGREAGVAIPQDLSVLGYDDIPTAIHVIPQLSTIAQPIAKMGEIAAQTLLDHMLDHSAPVRSIMLENTLKVRGTTAPPGG